MLSNNVKLAQGREVHDQNLNNVAKSEYFLTDNQLSEFFIMAPDIFIGTLSQRSFIFSGLCNSDNLLIIL